MNRMITLQINTTGAWRNLFAFPSHRLAAVKEALVPLQAVAGPTVKWCLYEDGRRTWLPTPLANAFAREQQS